MRLSGKFTVGELRFVTELVAKLVSCEAMIVLLMLKQQI
jgi:hypothetical protein